MDEQNIAEAGYTSAEWDGSPSRFSDEQLLAAVPKAMAAWAAAQAKETGKSVRQFCHLPIREPGGAVNVRALANAKARIGQVEGVPKEVLDASLEEINRLQMAHKGKMDKGECTLPTDMPANEYRRVLGLAENACTTRLIKECCTLDAHAFDADRSDAKLLLQSHGYSPTAKHSTGELARLCVIKSGISKNKNKWRDPVLEAGSSKFEGAKSYYDHRDGDKRGFRDLIGTVKRPKKEADGIYGVLRSHKGAQFYRDVVTDMPELVGASVYVYAHSKPDDADPTVEDVQEILSVVSVDIVDNPSAGGGVVEVLERANDATPPQKEEEEGVEVKELEAKLAEAQKSLDAYKAAADAEKAALQVAVASAKKEASDALAKVAAYERKEQVEQAITRARAAGRKIGSTLEQAIRLSLTVVPGALSTEIADGVVAEWCARAEALVKEAVPAAPIAIPPAAAAQPAVVKVESVEEKQAKVQSLVYASMFGVQA